MTNPIVTTTADDVLTPDIARVLTDAIVATVADAWGLITAAYVGRAWSALGYSSWDDYCSTEFGSLRLRLPREERQEVVASLRESGLSIRAIAATGIASKQTVERDIAGVMNQDTSPEEHHVPDDEEHQDEDVVATVRRMAEDLFPAGPTKITGTDGKSYPAPTPRQSKPRRGPLTDEAMSAAFELDRVLRRIERIAADDRFPANRDRIVDSWRHPLTRAAELLQRIDTTGGAA